MYRRMRALAARLIPVGLLCFLALLATPHAYAQLSASIQPIYVSPLVIGQTGAGPVTLAIQDTAGTLPSITVTNIQMNTACSTTGQSLIGTDFSCAGSSYPGVITLSTTGTGATTNLGGNATCVGPWAISLNATTGLATFTGPSGNLVLTAGEICTITFTMGAAAMPPPGTQKTQMVFGNAGMFITSGTLGPGPETGFTQTLLESCAATLDKQVSCDGTTWYDVTGGTDDPSGTTKAGPVCAFGTLVHRRYLVTNTGGAPASSCTLTDNPTVTITPTPTAFPLPVSTSPVTFSTANVSCNLTGSANGDDTATLNCSCASSTNTVNAATVTDTATYACCGVQVDKQISCDPADGVSAIWTDQGFNDPTTSKCTGKVGSNVAARWFAKNLGNVDTSCTLGDNNTTFNVVASATGTFGIPAGTASQPVSTTYSGLCQDARATETGGTDIATLSCSCAAPGLTNTLSTLTATDTAGFDCCGVSVDKQVSCNGGTDWVDQGFGDSAVGTCNALVPNNINFRYFARNNGSIAASCGFTDTQNGNANLIFSVAAGGLSLPVSGNSVPVTLSAVTKACSSTLGGNEPNTGTLDCTCADPVNGTVEVSNSDTASFTCQSVPGLSLLKTCASQSGSTNAVTITATNTGQVPLTSCHVTDTYYTALAICPSPIPAGSVGTDLGLVPPLLAGQLIPDASMVVGAAPYVINASISSLTADTCNTTHIDCVAAGAPATATCAAGHLCGDANAVCAVPPTGCFTRTIGYWGTHPDNTLEVLTHNGGSVSSCGLNLTTVDLSYLGPFSTSQDLCSNGQDSKGAGASPQQTSLVRQCAGAAINLAASRLGGLGCGSDAGAGSILAAFNVCCGVGGVCATGGTTINGQTLDACNTTIGGFNEQFDNIDLPSFLTDVPANPKLYCQIARGDGHMNTGAGRVYTKK